MCLLYYFQFIYNIFLLFHRISNKTCFELPAHIHYYYYYYFDVTQTNKKQNDSMVCSILKTRSAMRSTAVAIHIHTHRQSDGSVHMWIEVIRAYETFDVRTEWSLSYIGPSASVEQVIYACGVCVYIHLRVCVCVRVYKCVCLSEPMRFVLATCCHNNCQIMRLAKAFKCPKRSF